MKIKCPHCKGTGHISMEIIEKLFRITPEKKDVIALKELGLTYGDIGKIYKISRQRAHQIATNR